PFNLQEPQGSAQSLGNLTNNEQ
ncbi:hypothetical protein LCGC14_2095600, partial [marine sediment metagenome]